MWILCLAEDSLETSSLIFSEKQWKKYLWMSSAAVMIGALRVNKYNRQESGHDYPFVLVHWLLDLGQFCKVKIFVRGQFCKVKIFVRGPFCPILHDFADLLTGTTDCIFQIVQNQVKWMIRK